MDDLKNREDYIGEFTITIADTIYVKSDMAPEALNYWLDRAKLMILAGDVEAVEEINI